MSPARHAGSGTRGRAARRACVRPMSTEANAYAFHLATTLSAAARRRHETSDPWERGRGVMAFDVELCKDDLPVGYVARVVVSVTPG